MPDRWTGDGPAPSREAAIEWARRHGVEPEDAEKIADGSGKAMGDEARALAREAVLAFMAGKPWSDRPWWVDNNVMAILGIHPTSLPPERRGVPNRVSMAQLEDEIARGPQVDETDTRVPLWPYEASPEVLADLTVEDHSRMAPATGMDERGRLVREDRIGARYFEQDTLAPLRWSTEQRADLQRVMQGLGLYGDSGVSYGSWGAKDQALFAEVLATSNVEGVLWHETIAGWRRNGVPPELEAQLKGEAPRRPTIQVTNPADIRQTARAVSRDLTGAVDRSFTEATVGPYQAVEAAAQTSVYDDQEAGGGGTVVQAPSVDAFADEKLRREQPLEVDGYQFLNQFQAFTQMLGVQ